MTTELDTTPFAYRISSFLSDGRPRFIVQRADSLVPSTALSIYEQHLNHKTGSHNSIKTEINVLFYLFTWAIEENIDIENLLLTGGLLSALQIRRFAYWLSCRGTIKANELEALSVSAFNRALMYSSKLIRWFAKHYGVGNGNCATATEKELAIKSQQELFSGAKKKDRRVRCAPDLTEEEIYTIDQYLKPENRKDASIEVAARDYLFWRIAIEFGLREGEILALRLRDCPHKDRDYFDIVRIEERGPSYRDPRGANAPRPKTLSRPLGFKFQSQIRKHLSDYTTQHRYRLVDRGGKQFKQFMLGHDFLIVNHHRTPGEPLSVSGVQTIAQQISRHTGIPFHWHLTRHAFFNRMYASIVDIRNDEDKKAKLSDLVFWGGWSDEKSLQIYVNRARQVRAQKALMLWQNGGNKWEALGL